MRTRHPPTVHLPLGLLFGGWVAAGARLGWSSERWHDVITFCLTGGLVTAAVAASTGFAELVRVGPSIAGTPADRAVLTHLGLVLAGVSVIGLSLWAHIARHEVLTFAVATFGVVLLGAGGHVGGILVYRHRIGTDCDHEGTLGT